MDLIEDITIAQPVQNPDSNTHFDESQDEKTALLNAIYANNLSEVQIQIFRHPLVVSEINLALICKRPEIASEMIKLLVDHTSIKLDAIDRQFYAFEAIHYVTKLTDPRKVDIICAKLTKFQVNSLSALSENALHILLRHGKYAKSCHATLKNGSTSTRMELVSTENHAVVKCAETLIESGIDVNHPDFWNQTPLLLAVKMKYYRVVKLLLDTPNIDLDLNRDSDGKTARDLLRNKGNYFGLLPKYLPTGAPRKMLFHFLKSGDEEAFVRFNSGKIGKYADSWDGYDRNNSSCTLLQYCFRRSFLLCGMWDKKRSHCLIHRSHYDEEILSSDIVLSFCQKGMIKCIEHLLKNGANINFTIRKFDKPLLKVAVLKGFYPFVCMLLNNITAHQNLLKTDDLINDILRESLTRDRYEVNFGYTATILLNEVEKIDNFHPDETTKLALVDFLLQKLNSHKKIESSVNLLHIMKLVGFPSSDNNTKYLLEGIGPEIVKQYLDSCIEGDSLGTTCLNYDGFVGCNETEILEVFVESPILFKCLTHVLFKVLIRSKWDKFKSFFFLNLTFYVLFYLVLNFVIILEFNNVGSSVGGLFLKFLNVLCLLVFSTKEILQINVNYKKYFRDSNNYGELLLIIIYGSTVFLNFAFKKVFMVLSVLCSNLVLLMMLEQVPNLAKYMIILKTVKYYLRYTIFYCILFVGFAICFYILFCDPQNDVFWSALPLKLFEVIILFTGNLDYLEKENFDKSDIFGRLVFLVFVFFMAIIVNNLLLGLLVTDIDNIQKDAKLFEQIGRANFIIKVENFVSQNFLAFWPSEKMKIFNDGPRKIYVDLDNNCSYLNNSDRLYLESICSHNNKKQDVSDKLLRFMRNFDRFNHKLDNHIEINKEILSRLRKVEGDILSIKESLFKNGSV